MLEPYSKSYADLKRAYSVQQWWIVGKPQMQLFVSVTENIH